MTTRPSHPSNGEEEHAPLEFLDWGSFKILDVLGRGRTGTVFKAVLRGETVALKTCDLWQHPDYEKELEYPEGSRVRRVVERLAPWSSTP